MLLSRTWKWTYTLWTDVEDELVLVNAELLNVLGQLCERSSQGHGRKRRGRATHTRHQIAAIVVQLSRLMLVLVAFVRSSRFGVR